MTPCKKESILYQNYISFVIKSYHFKNLPSNLDFFKRLYHFGATCGFGRKWVADWKLLKSTRATCDTTPNRVSTKNKNIFLGIVTFHFLRKYNKYICIIFKTTFQCGMTVCVCSVIQDKTGESEQFYQKRGKSFYWRLAEPVLCQHFHKKRSYALWFTVIFLHPLTEVFSISSSAIFVDSVPFPSAFPTVYITQNIQLHHWLK